MEAVIIKLQNECRAPDPLYRQLIRNFQEYQSHNNLIIIPADKNAGICILNQRDYNSEVLRQLEDLSSYHPTTKGFFNIRMDYLNDEIRMFSSRFPEQLKLKSLLPREYKAANFYILPKVHKPFVGIPKGRPISSTIHTLNRGISRLLDTILQPVMNFVPDMILDSAHMLILLRNLKLDPTRKYMLVTADIDALYPNLNIANCKKFTCSFFEEYKHLINLPFDVTSSELLKLLDWSLDYSFVEFNSEYFYQHRGIQMGNNASVCIANIAVFNELREMYRNCVGLFFRARFIDDIFMIVDITNIIDPDEWCNQSFKHDYLKFTYTHSKKSVDFLDLTISLDETNSIKTALYKKPINKHQYLHYNSAHPKHLLNSLPYSCFIRVIRSCSDVDTRILELNALQQKFLSRSYPESVLKQCLDKIKHMTQDTILIPRKPLIISNLRIHNPNILSQFNVHAAENTGYFTNRMFIVVPFYKNILGMGNVVKQFFNKHCNSPRFTKYIEDIHISIAYKQPTRLQQFIKN